MSRRCATQLVTLSEPASPEAKQEMAEMGYQEALAAKKMTKKGGSTLPFDQLCAPGPNLALCHPALLAQLGRVSTAARYPSLFGR